MIFNICNVFYVEPCLKRSIPLLQTNIRCSLLEMPSLLDNPKKIEVIGNKNALKNVEYVYCKHLLRYNLQWYNLCIAKVIIWNIAAYTRPIRDSLYTQGNSIYFRKGTSISVLYIGWNLNWYELLLLTVIPSLFITIIFYKKNLRTWQKQQITLKMSPP